MNTANTTQTQIAELMKRPDLDQALAGYERTRDKLQDSLSAALGPLAWAQESGTARRGTYLSALWSDPGFNLVDSDDANTAHPALWFAPVSLTPATAAAITTATTQVGSEVGFIVRGPRVSRPSDYQLTLTDDVRTALSVGAGRNFVLALKTSCHLTAEARQRAAAGHSPSPSSRSTPR